MRYISGAWVCWARHRTRTHPKLVKGCKRCIAPTCPRYYEEK